MLIVLFGGSATGKTTLGRALATRTGIDVRHSGEEIRDAARRLCVPFPNLPMEEHARVDQETRAWCVERDEAIVEGRFLDQVLGQSPQDVLAVKVEATMDVRARRSAERAGRGQTVSDIETFDREDDAFRVRAYDAARKLAARFTLDTTALPVDACVERLIAWRSELRPG